MRLMMMATIVALATAPALAQDRTTLDYVTTKGTVIKGSAQGMELTLPMTYKPDGTYSTEVMGQTGGGTWRIDGDKLCTISQMGGGAENCIAYPAGKKPGDTFTINHPMLGEASVTINK